MSMNYVVEVSRYSTMQMGWIKAYRYVASSLDVAKIMFEKQMEYCGKQFSLDTLSFTLSKGMTVYDSRMQVAESDYQKFYGLDSDGDHLMTCQEKSEGMCMRSCPEECRFRASSNPF